MFNLSVTIYQHIDTAQTCSRCSVNTYLLNVESLTSITCYSTCKFVFLPRLWHCVPQDGILRNNFSLDIVTLFCILPSTKQKSENQADASPNTPSTRGKNNSQRRLTVPKNHSRKAGLTLIKEFLYIYLNGEQEGTCNYDFRTWNLNFFF